MYSKNKIADLSWTGLYTNVSLTVIPRTGLSWHAGGRTAREAELIVNAEEQPSRR